MKKLLVLTALLLCAAHLSAQRLPRTVFPSHYDITFAPDFKTDKYEGDVKISVSVQQPLRQIILNSKEIEFREFH